MSHLYLTGMSKMDVMEHVCSWKPWLAAMAHHFDIYCIILSCLHSLNRLQGGAENVVWLCAWREALDEKQEIFAIVSYFAVQLHMWKGPCLAAEKVEDVVQARHTHSLLFFCLYLTPKNIKEKVPFWVLTMESYLKFYLLFSSGGLWTMNWIFSRAFLLPK